MSEPEYFLSAIDKKTLLYSPVNRPKRTTNCFFRFSSEKTNLEIVPGLRIKSTVAVDNNITRKVFKVRTNFAEEHRIVDR